MILGILYFFLPLVATFLFSLRAEAAVLSFLAYQQLFNDQRFYNRLLVFGAMGRFLPLLLAS